MFLVGTTLELKQDLMGTMLEIVKPTQAVVVVERV